MERAHVGCGLVEADGVMLHAEPKVPRGLPLAAQAFTAGMASRILGVRIERLRTWHVRGVLVPSVAGPTVLPPRRGATGRRPGSIGRRYSRVDLVVGWVVRELLASGVRLEHLRPAVALLRARADGADADPADRAGSHLVLLRSGAVVLLQGDEAWALPRRDLRAIVSLSLATATLQARVAEWSAVRGAVPISPTAQVSGSSRS
jgi:DNA-binding transcriptional MerR regulator